MAVVSRVWRSGHLAPRVRRTHPRDSDPVSVWTNRPCDRCGRRKGPKYRDSKDCYRCTSEVRREVSDRAHRARVARVYGIEPGDYDKLYAAQGGRCALCLRATGASRRLSVDHDHATGKVRGLLCRTCNGILGHARDDPYYFDRAWRYLVLPPANSVLERLPDAKPDP